MAASGWWQLSFLSWHLAGDLYLVVVAVKVGQCPAGQFPLEQEAVIALLGEVGAGTGRVRGGESHSYQLLRDSTELRGQLEDVRLPHQGLPAVIHVQQFEEVRLAWLPGEGFEDPSSVETTVLVDGSNALSSLKVCLIQCLKLVSLGIE